jgi:hypothetical protein
MIIMKKFLLFLSFASIMALVFTACTSTPKTDELAAAALKEQAAATVNPDTVGLSQFQAWKAQNELANAEDFNNPEQEVAAPVKTAKKSYKAPAKAAAPKVVYVPTPAPQQAPAPTTTSNTSNESENVGSGTSESEGTAQAPAPEAKKGISKSVKGAVIGGVVGAVGGAVINKNNRVAGAVIGGVIGAAGGYGIGRGMDKKDGRIEMIAN